MIPALVTVKAILSKADTLASEQTDVTNGLTISLYQDSIELYLWTLVKKLNLTTQEKAGFVAYINAIETSGSTVLYRNQLFELNTARVNFKHYGNFPASSDVIKFGVVSREFFFDSCQNDFGVAFESISIVRLIRDLEIQSALKQSEEFLASDNLKGSAEHLGITLYLMTRALSHHIPRIQTKNLYPRSGLSEHESNAQTGFENVGNSLEAIRDLLVIGLNRIDFRLNIFSESYLPTTHRTISGKFYQNHNRMHYEQEKLSEIHNHLLESCIRTGL